MSAKQGPVLAVSNLKGGTGKTVLSVHLAYLLGATLLDLDPQGDAHDWGTRSGLVTSHHAHGAEEVFSILESTPGPIVLDTPPGEGVNLRTALAVSDVVIVPVKPGSSDLRALGRMEKLIQDARAVNPGLKVGVVLNEAKATTSITRAVEDALGNLQGVVYLGHLGDRVAFPEALAQGGLVQTPPASEEIGLIVSNLQKLIKG